MKSSKLSVSQDKKNGVLLSQVPISSKKVLGRTLIGHLSDFHSGPITAPKHIDKVFNTLRPFELDYLFLTGDFIQISNTGFRYKFKAGLKSKDRISDYCRVISKQVETLPQKTRVIGCLGNHDHLDGAKEIIEALGPRCEILVNETLVLNDYLSVSAVDDLQRGEADLKVLETHPEKFQILLSHNPDIVLHKHADKINEYDLMLSGHTHGGQIKLPYFPPPITRTKQREHIKGASNFNNTNVYVTNGVGFGGIPLRVCCPPEAVVFTLSGT